MEGINVENVFVSERICFCVTKDCSIYIFLIKFSVLELRILWIYNSKA